MEELDRNFSNRTWDAWKDKIQVVQTTRGAREDMVQLVQTEVLTHGGTRYSYFKHMQKCTER